MIQSARNHGQLLKRRREAQGYPARRDREAETAGLANREIPRSSATAIAV